MLLDTMVRRMFAIGLARYGCSNRPFYHIAVMKAKVIPKQPVDERVIEQIGSFDPLPNKHNEKMVAINFERLRYWISQNARPSLRVAELLGKLTNEVFVMYCIPARHRFGKLQRHKISALLLLGLVKLCKFGGLVLK